jgi:hypothetical protein
LPREWMEMTEEASEIEDAKGFDADLSRMVSAPQ